MANVPTRPFHVNPWVAARHDPLRLPTKLNSMPNNYINILLKFNGESDFSIEYHMIAFQDFTDKLYIEHDDVCMRLLFKHFKGMSYNGS